MSKPQDDGCWGVILLACVMAAVINSCHCRQSLERIEKHLEVEVPVETVD